MAPQAVKKPAEKTSEKKIKAHTKLGAAKKKVTKTSVQNYRIYIRKVLKRVHPRNGISREAMEIMNSFMNDMFEKLAQEAGRLARDKKKRTITPLMMQTAVQLILPGELARCAMVEGTEAVTNFNTSARTPGDRAAILDDLVDRNEGGDFGVDSEPRI